MDEDAQDRSLCVVIVMLPGKDRVHVTVALDEHTLASVRKPFELDPVVLGLPPMQSMTHVSLG